MRFTDEQRRRLAAKSKEPGRGALHELDTLITADALHRWHRQLIANKYDGSTKRRPARPGIPNDVAAHIVRMARENRWGYLRFRGSVTNLGHTVARTTSSVDCIMTIDAPPSDG